MMKSAILASAAASLLVLSACSAEQTAETPAEQGSTSATLAAVLSDAEDLSLVQTALADTGLRTIFDGNAAYTLFAPTDEAFAAIDADLDGPEAEAAMIAILRDHIVTGALTREDLANAVASASGPVEMRTMGTGTLTFSGTAEDLVITSSDGSQAHIAGTVLRATNGAVFPIDAVLKDFTAG